MLPNDGNSEDRVKMCHGNVRGELQCRTSGSARETTEMTAIAGQGQKKMHGKAKVRTRARGQNKCAPLCVSEASPARSGAAKGGLRGLKPPPSVRNSSECPFTLVTLRDIF